MELISSLFYLIIGVSDSSAIKIVSGWFFCLTLTWHYYMTKRIYLTRFYLGGILCYAIAMMWLEDSIAFYYSLPPLTSFALFFLFTLVNAFHFLISAFLVNAFTRYSAYPQYVIMPLAFFISQCAVPPLSRENIGTSQFRFSLISQTADVWGTEGISFLMFLLSSLFWHVYLRKPIQKKCIAVVMICVTLFACRSLTFLKDTDSEKLTIGIVPSHISQSRVLDSSSAESLLAKLREFSFELITENPDINLLVWPESSVLYDIKEDADHMSTSEEQYPLPGLHIPIFFGAQERVNSSTLNPQYYNSAILLRPNGDIGGKYRKQHLFPMSEFIPFRENIAKLIPDLKLGYEFITTSHELHPILFHSGKKLFSIAPLICYDDLISASVKGYAVPAEVPQLLLTISNASWFKLSHAIEQHNDLAKWRSIEFRQSFIRVSRNGISSGYDFRGTEIFQLNPTEDATYVVRNFPVKNPYTTVYAIILPYYPLISITILAVLLYKMIASQNILHGRSM